MSADQLPASWLDRLARWAADQSELGELWLYGSRVKGLAKPDSALDIAVRLKQIPELDATVRLLADWQKSLQFLLPVQVSVSLLGGDFLTESMTTEIAVTGIRVFWRG